MFERTYKEFSFNNLKIHDIKNDEDLKIPNTNLNKNNIIDNLQKLLKSNTSTNDNLKFLEVMRNYDEKFIMVSQMHKPLFLEMSLNDVLRLFSVPICTNSINRQCKINCDCIQSSEIGLNMYDRGGIHNFHQLGSYLIGFILEQDTDPLSRVAIKFDRNMSRIKKIYCKCKIYYCPHAFLLLYFRLQLKNFYSIKLPTEIFDNHMSQDELGKLYSFLIEEARSLPILRDYHSKCWNLDESYKQTHLKLPYIYAFCHKILLPLDSAIVDEQTRARKWISDLYMKRSCQSLAAVAPIPNAGEIFHNENNGSNNLLLSNSNIYKKNSYKNILNKKY